MTFATFARYLLGCGYDFRITVFPIKGAKGARQVRGRTASAHSPDRVRPFRPPRVRPASFAPL